MARTRRLRAGWGVGWGWGGGVRKKNPRGNVKSIFSKKKCPPPFLLPAAKTPRLEGAALHLLPAARHRRSRPHPSARAIPLGSARCSLVCIRTRPVRGERGLASQQCSRSCTPSANQLQLQCTAKTPLAGSPRPVCDARSHGPFAAPPSGAAASPAASCAMHCTPLVQDLQGHAPHLRRRAHSSRTRALLPRGN